MTPRAVRALILLRDGLVVTTATVLALAALCLVRASELVLGRRD